MWVFVDECEHNIKRNIYEKVEVYGAKNMSPHWFIGMKIPARNDFSEQPFFAKDCNQKLRRVISKIYLDVILKLAEFKSKKEVKRITLGILELLYPSTLDRISPNSKYNILLKETIKTYETRESVVYNNEHPKISIHHRPSEGIVVKYNNKGYDEYGDNQIFYKYKYDIVPYKCEKDIKKDIEENLELAKILAWVDLNIVSRIKKINYQEVIILADIARSRIMKLDMDFEEKIFYADSIKGQSITLLFKNIENDLPF